MRTPKVVVMPAYNAARTLVRTYRDIPRGGRPRDPGRRRPTDNLGDAFQRYRCFFERS